MIRRQENLNSFRNAVVQETIIFGDSYLRHVMPEYDPSRTTLDYHKIRDRAKHFIDMYTEELRLLDEKEKKIHEEFEKFRLEKKRRNGRKKRIDIRRIQYQREHNIGIPPKHLSLEDSEKRDTLRGLIRSLRIDYSCPDCTNSLRFWLVHLKESKEADAVLPTILHIRVYTILRESNDCVTATFEHPMFPTPFRSSITIGLLYYIYGEPALDMIVREAYLSFDSIEKRNNNAKFARQEMKKKSKKK